MKGRANRGQDGWQSMRVAVRFQDRNPVPDSFAESLAAPPSALTGITLLTRVLLLLFHTLTLGERSLASYNIRNRGFDPPGRMVFLISCRQKGPNPAFYHQLHRQTPLGKNLRNRALRDASLAGLRRANGR